MARAIRVRLRFQTNLASSCGARELANNRPVVSARLETLIRARAHHAAMRSPGTQGLHGQDLSPFFEEFYSVRFVEYASSLQKKNGIQNSLFYRFANHIPYISLSKKSVMAELNPYFLLSPQETEQASVELRNFNIKNKHPAEFQHVARHLEGVLLASANDKTPDNISSLSAGLKTGVMFCGHD